MGGSLGTEPLSSGVLPLVNSARIDVVDSQLVSTGELLATRVVSGELYRVVNVSRKTLVFPCLCTGYSGLKFPSSFFSSCVKYG